jgi:hypothetical protein
VGDLPSTRATIIVQICLGMLYDWQSLPERRQGHT